MENINAYILEKVQEGKIDKAMAFKILKQLRGTTTKETDKDIAVIGMACRFSGARNVQEFWQNLLEGVNCITKVPDKRKRNALELYDSITMDMEFFKQGYLEEIDNFDAEFFRISPNEAVSMEPAHRLFLETAYEAIEDGGYGGRKLWGTDTGVFVGTDHTNKSPYSSKIVNSGMAGQHSFEGMLASRVSFALNLKGPSIVLDSACSSGLVSVHSACRALQNKECGIALAGGVNILYKSQNENGEKSAIESEDYTARPFDDKANGTVWGEGVAALLLKPLKEAVNCGDHIYAVIKGTAINNNGTSSAITVPNPMAQEELILRAWKEAEIDPETISYIEAFGTSTYLGDPIEIKGLTQAFRRHTKKKQFCGIGSLKGYLGHTVGVSGIAAMIKVIMAMNHGKIPPTSNFQKPNKFIDFCNSPVHLVDRVTEWETNGARRRAGVSCFAFTGTNGHVVLEEADAYNRDDLKSDTANILTLSTLYEDGITELVKRYLRFMSTNIRQDIRDICYTANTGRGYYPIRLVVIASSWEELKYKLEFIDRNGLKSNQEQGIFFGSIKIISNPTEGRTPWEITELERGEKTKSAAELLEEIKNSESIPADKLKELGFLYTTGAAVEWDNLYSLESRRKVSLPAYPFRKTRYWITLDNGDFAEGNDDEAHKNLAEAQNFEGDIVRAEYVPPQNQSQYLLAEVWTRVLEVQNISIKDDFFNLGGDSTKAAQIISYVTKFYPEFGINEMFENSTIEKMAALIDEKGIILYPEDVGNLNERQEMEEEYNEDQIGDSRAYMDYKLVDEIFDEQTEKYPQGLISLPNGETAAFDDLKEISNIIPGLYNISAGERIGIITEDPYKHMEFTLGVLKAGGICVIIDADVSDAAVENVLKECDIHQVFTDRKAFIDRFNGIKTSFAEEIHLREKEKCNYISRPENTAYIIYRQNNDGTLEKQSLSHRDTVQWVLRQNTGDITDNEVLSLLYPAQYSKALTKLPPTEVHITTKKVLKIVLQKKINNLLLNAYPLCVVLTQEKMYPWFYENYVQLYFIANRNYRFFNAAWLDFYRGMSGAEKVLIYKHYDISFSRETDIIGFIEMQIHQGYYVYTYFDESFIKGGEPFAHDIMIYGFDRESKNLYVLGFNNNLMFVSYSIDYDTFRQAFQKGIESFDNMERLTYITLMKPRFSDDHTYSFDLNIFLQNLYDYLQSENNYPENEDRYAEFKDPGRVFGMGIYQHVLNYFNNIGISGDDLDYRVFHTYYEHKMGLSERFEYIFQLLSIDDNELRDFINEYRENIANGFNKLRGKAHKYNLSGKPKELLEGIIYEFSILKEDEEKLLPSIYEHLRQYNKKRTM